MKNHNQANDQLLIDESLEKQILDIICGDNVDEFLKLKKQNLNLIHVFSNSWVLDYEHPVCQNINSAHFYNNSILNIIVIANAVKIADSVIEPFSKNPKYIMSKPIYDAVIHDAIDVLRLLIDRGYDPNQKWVGETPIFAAVQFQKYEACEVLIGSGKCNPYLKNHGVHHSTLQEAARQGRLDIVKLIVELKLDKKVAIIAAIDAADHAHEDIALYLLDKLEEKRKENDEQAYPYHIVIPAVLNNLTRLITRMLEREPRVINLVNRGRTMLSSACEANNIELARKFIALGAQVNIFTRYLMGGVSINGKYSSEVAKKAERESGLYGYNGREIVPWMTNNDTKRMRLQERWGSVVLILAALSLRPWCRVIFN